MSITVLYILERHGSDDGEQSSLEGIVQETSRPDDGESDEEFNDGGDGHRESEGDQTVMTTTTT